MHLQLSKTIELSQALLRASKRLHTLFQSAGFACSTPARSVATSVEGTTLTDQFLLGTDEQRMTACLQLEVQTHGAVVLRLTLAHTGFSTGPLLKPVTLYDATRTVGVFLWAKAESETDRYQKAEVMAQFERMGLDILETLLPDAWQTAMLSVLEP
jgi:hypothetical protein